MKSTPRYDYDWCLAIKYWRGKYQRSGLTLHALASICKRDPLQLLEEIEAHPGTTWGFCSVVLAPVFRIFSGTVEPDYRRPASVLLTARKLLKQYPWPKYKGIVAGKGSTTAFEQDDVSYMFYDNDTFPKTSGGLLRSFRTYLTLKNAYVPKKGAID